MRDAAHPAVASVRPSRVEPAAEFSRRPAVLKTLTRCNDETAPAA